jgi:hypothetical protein
VNFYLSRVDCGDVHATFFSNFATIWNVFFFVCVKKEHMYLGAELNFCYINFHIHVSCLQIVSLKSCDGFIYLAFSVKTIYHFGTDSSFKLKGVNT